MPWLFAVSLLWFGLVSWRPLIPMPTPMVGKRSTLMADPARHFGFERNNARSWLPAGARVSAGLIGLRTLAQMLHS